MTRRQRDLLPSPTFILNSEFHQRFVSLNTPESRRIDPPRDSIWTSELVNGRVCCTLHRWESLTREGTPAIPYYYPTISALFLAANVRLCSNLAQVLQTGVRSVSETSAAALMLRIKIGKTDDGLQGCLFSPITWATSSNLHTPETPQHWFTNEARAPSRRRATLTGESV